MVDVQKIGQGKAPKGDGCVSNQNSLTAGPFSLQFARNLAIFSVVPICWVRNESNETCRKKWSKQKEQ